MKRFFNFDKERKVLFFICVAKKSIKELNSSEQKETANNALNACRKQIVDKKYDGELLYNYLDNEENGITLFQEMTDDNNESSIWNCVIDAVAYSSKFAYDSLGAEYYPEPIALVDDELVDHLIKSYNNCIADEKFIIELLDLISNANINYEFEKKSRKLVNRAQEVLLLRWL